jgi:threonine dehydrogenase-like Zn-dependent dehydrogenase
MFMTYAPEIMGHEFSGTIVEVGEGVQGLSPGLQVVGDPRVPCHKCQWCLEDKINLCPQLGFIGEVTPGCFAPYLLMDPAKLLIIPPDIPLLEAVMVEPLAVAVHIIRSSGLNKMKNNERIGIIGAGPIGLLTMMTVKELCGVATVMVDITRERLELAKLLGADKCLNSVTEMEDNSIEAAVEAVGLGFTLQESMRCLKPQGRLVMAGLYEEASRLDPNPIVTKELRLAGINTYEKADLHEAIELIKHSKIKVRQLITDIISLPEIPRVLKDLDENGKISAKVVISMEEK